jgi:hypothetical protein
VNPYAGVAGAGARLVHKLEPCDDDANGGTSRFAFVLGFGRFLEVSDFRNVVVESLEQGRWGSKSLLVDVTFRGRLNYREVRQTLVVTKLEVHAARPLHPDDTYESSDHLKRMQESLGKPEDHRLFGESRILPRVVTPTAVVSKGEGVKSRFGISFKSYDGAELGCFGDLVVDTLEQYCKGGKAMVDVTLRGKVELGVLKDTLLDCVGDVDDMEVFCLKLTDTGANSKLLASIKKGKSDGKHFRRFGE